MKIGTTYLDVFRNPSRRIVEFYITDKGINGKMSIGAPVVMSEIEDASMEQSPTIVMDMESFQNFIDELWKSGFRPSNLSESELSALGKHLEDMRRIAFKFLDAK